MKGMLFIEKDGQLVLIERGTSHRLTTIEPGDNLEIHLGIAWIEGIFRPYFTDDGQMVAPYILACEPGLTFCGLVSGMSARIEEGRKPDGEVL